MDVNGIGQNMILNAYNSNLSEYAETNEEIIPQVPRVQQSEAKGSKDSSTQNQEYNKKDLDAALKKVNNFLRDEHTHAEYSIHKDFGTIMIKIVDEDTKEVVLEVPPEKILDMVASMCRQVGLFDRKA